MAKVLEFQLRHLPSNEYSGLISFRMDWFDLLAVQGILKSLLQHMNLSKLWEIMKDRGASWAAVHGVARSWT